MKNVSKKKNGGGRHTCTVLILNKIRSSKYFIFLFLHDHYFCCHYGLLQMAKDKTSLKEMLLIKNNGGFFTIFKVGMGIIIR